MGCFLTNDTRKIEKVDNELEERSEHAKGKENVKDGGNVEDNEAELDVEESETESGKDDQENEDDGDTKVPAKAEEESTKENTANNHQTKGGHVGRKEVTDPTPPADDATKLDKGPVDVETPEEKEVVEEVPAVEPAEDKDEDTTQMMEEETKAGDAANDM